jgi:Cu+-exporting ATPase
MSRFAFSYIALLAVLSASQVASMQVPSISKVIDAEGKAQEASVKFRKEEKPEALLQLNGKEEVVMFDIDGMMCENCAANVERALSGVPGVRGASVSYTNRKGQVHFHPSIASTDAMVNAVKGIGMKASLWQEGEKPEALLQLNGKAETAMLRIDGMTCHKCSAAVESALSGVPGVRGASVSHITHVAQVQFHPSVANKGALVDAVRGAGFDAYLLLPGKHLTQKQESLLQLDGKEEVAMLHIDGMMCGKCATNIERALSSVPGVRGASVSHTTQRGYVQFYPRATSTAAMVDAVKDLGFGASLL